jgi:RNA-directed DNA polymerase
MDKSALRLISDPAFLRPVWREMYSSSRKSRRDILDEENLSFNRFKEKEEEQLVSISRALRARVYQPIPLNPFFVPKENGKERLICVPSIPDRLVQRSVLKFLNENGCSFDNPVSYGFIKNKSVKKAAKAAIDLRKNNQWVYKTDISSFFDNVDRSILKGAYRKKIPFKSLYWLLDRVIDTEVRAPNYEMAVRIKDLGIISGLGVRQGMPLSPMFANAMLVSFDNEIIKKKIKMVRYADDFLILAKSEAECLAAHTLCKGILSKISLAIPEIADGSKTSIHNESGVVGFLGLALSGADKDFRIGITKKQKDAIRKKFYAYADMDFCEKNKVFLSDVLQSINGLISSYSSVYDVCDNFPDISNYLFDLRKMAFVEVLRGLGLKIDSLTKRQKAFLQIDFK